MNMQAFRNEHDFPRPDMNAIRHYRTIIAQRAGSQSGGILREQQLVILDLVYRVDAELLKLLDGVRVSLGSVDIEEYRIALRKLDHDGRTSAENLAFVAYQQELASEMTRGVETARNLAERLNLNISSLLSAPLVDTHAPVAHAHSLMLSAGPLLEERHKRALEFLLEDLEGALHVAQARGDYVDEINKVLSPLTFFFDNVLESEQDVIQTAEEFHGRVSQLLGYLEGVRNEWQG